VTTHNRQDFAARLPRNGICPGRAATGGELSVSPFGPDPHIDYVS
jgi:hypothetical protein